MAVIFVKNENQGSQFVDFENKVNYVRGFVYKVEQNKVKTLLRKGILTEVPKSIYESANQRIDYTGGADVFKRRPKIDSETVKSIVQSKEEPEKNDLNFNKQDMIKKIEELIEKEIIKKRGKGWLEIGGENIQGNAEKLAEKALIDTEFGSLIESEFKNISS